MNINRDNYEEYFLLYADNELTDYEKGEVLRFIRENKDLEGEFKMIQDTICKPEANINLADKSFLLRDAESNFITEKNYETVFVLYHDNELTTAQKNKTDLFLIQHPQLKNEFELFGKAKLKVDNSILFPGKNKLYKKEKAGKIIPIMWRSLAAAVFIGFGFWIVQKYYMPETVQPPVAVHISPANKSLPQQKINPLSADKKDNEMATVEKPKDKNSSDEVDVKPKTILKEKVKENQDLVATSLSKPAIKTKKFEDEKRSVNIPEEKINNDLAVSSTNINGIPQMPVSAKMEKPFKGDVEQKALSYEADQPAMQVHTASYVNDGSDKNENYVFYNITTEEFRKSKVGGFLKKVKRVVERNNPITHLFSGDEKQVASN